MKAIKQYFHLILFIILHEVLLAFAESVDKALLFPHPNESY